MSPGAQRLILALPIVVFIWQVLGATAAFSPVSRGRGGGFISLAFFGLVIRADSAPIYRTLLTLGCIGLAGAVVLFEWARRSIRGRFFSYIFSTDTPAFLHVDGPYAYVRNPFYSSYMLSMASTAVMLPGLHRWLIVVAAWFYFRHAAMFEERKFAQSPVAQEYEDYKRRTGRFIPRRLWSRRRD